MNVSQFDYTTIVIVEGISKGMVDKDSKKLMTFPYNCKQIDKYKCSKQLYGIW